jgi:hypothetical protein
VDWVPEFVDGNVRASCSICGCSRRAPDNLTLCPDKRWRCTDRCIEVSEFEINKILAASRKRKPQPDAGFGLGPWDEVVPTFLQAAQARVAQLFPTWTPTTTFQDAFDIVPGGGGSPWTTTVTGTGAAISLVSAGVARFISGTSATGQSFGFATALTIPNPGAGRFYSAFSFRTPVFGTATNTTVIGSGRADATARNAIGVRGQSAVGTAYYQLVAQGIGQSISYVETDATNFHLGEMWWGITGSNFGAAVFGSVDGGPYLAIQSTGIITRRPLVGVINNDLVAVVSSTLDVTDYVCFT